MRTLMLIGYASHPELDTVLSYGGDQIGNLGHNRKHAFPLQDPVD
jgi:hypothetical protein